MNPGLLSAQLRFAFRRPLVIAGFVILSLTGSASLILQRHWTPLFEEVAALESEIHKKSQALDQGVKDRLLLEAFQQSRERANLLQAKLSVKVTQAEVLRRLGNLAQRHGIKLLGESYRETPLEEGYRKIRLTLELQGEYRGLTSFLSDLTRQESFTQILKSRFEKTLGNDLRAELELLIPYRPEERRE